jgi:hypothetical protein
MGTTLRLGMGVTVRQRPDRPGEQLVIKQFREKVDFARKSSRGELPRRHQFPGGRAFASASLLPTGASCIYCPACPLLQQ